MRICKNTKSVHSDCADSVNRHKLLGWASETLSKLKSDKNFLRKTVKRKKRVDETADADHLMPVSKKGKCVEEEISELKTNDVATYVSEIVTSKTKRKIQHMAFDSTVTRDKHKKKASSKEHLDNIKTKDNGNNEYKSRAKHQFTLLSCSKDQEVDLYDHEESTEEEKKKKKKKRKESAYQNCSVDTCSSEDPLMLWVSTCKERPRKKQKVTEYSTSDTVSCQHCRTFASKEVNTRKKGINGNEETSMCEDMKYISGTRAAKKHKMHNDLYTGSKNKSSCFWKGVENTGPYKQEKKKRSKHTYDRVLDEDEQGNDYVPEECLKEKKKEKSYYTRSFSEKFVSEKKKLKKYKLYTQKHKYDEDQCCSEHESQMGVGVRCDSSSSSEEVKTFDGHYVSVGKNERRKHKQDCCCNDKLEGTKNQTHNSCKTKCTAERSKQKADQGNFYDHAVVKKKKKKKTKNYDICSENEIISEAADCSEPGPEKKRKRKKQKQNCKDNENVSNSEDNNKQKLYSDRDNVNSVAASYIQEKQKKKRKKSKTRKCNLSVDSKEETEKGRYEEDSSIGANQNLHEFVDYVLLDNASTGTEYSVKGKYKTGKKHKSDKVNVKKNKTSSVASEETYGNTAGTIQGGVMGDEDSSLTQAVKRSNGNDGSDRAILTSISINTQKSALHSTGIKRSKNIGSFGLSPIFRLLDKESEFGKSKHLCNACCGCTLRPGVTPHDSSEHAIMDVRKIIIKTEPGVIIKKEKEVFDNADAHVTDERMLGFGHDSQTELNTDYMNKTDDDVSKTENNDASVDKLGRQEHLSTGSGNGLNAYSTGGTESGFGTAGCEEGSSDEYVVNGNQEIDINTPFCNIYDDKITVKEEIFHLTDAHDEQNDGVNRTDGTSRRNFEFVGGQDMTLLHDSAARTQREGKADVNTVSQYEAVPLNELQSKCSSEVVPETASVHNTAWNAKETGSLCWPSVSGNEHQSSQFVDTETFTTGKVHFAFVPKWWRRERIAEALGVPVRAVYVHCSHYNSSIRKNYITVKFHDNQCLQKIVTHASRIHCARWFVKSAWSPWKKTHHSDWTTTQDNGLELFNQ